jgi:hypothetical protein
VAKKADLEAAHTRYADLTRQAVGLEAAHDYHAALRLAEECLTVLRDALAYQRRFLKTAQSASTAVDRILRLAPPLFARRSLDTLEAYFQGLKKADRAAFPNLPDGITAARQTLALAVRLWSELAQPPDTQTHPAAPDRVAAGIITVWVNAGLVARVSREGSTRYALVTDLRRGAWGKCPGCGSLRRASTVDLLYPLSCPSCGRQSEFVITQRVL